MISKHLPKGFHISKARADIVASFCFEITESHRASLKLKMSNIFEILFKMSASFLVKRSGRRINGNW